MKTKIIGHRGCRGLLPENSIQGFLKAIDLGVDAIELDIVMTKDQQLLVAHDPWFEHTISKAPKGTVNNFYQLSLSEIQQEPFGTLPHVEFPLQEKIKVIRPTLSEVIKTCLNYKPNIPPGFFVIEVKSQADWYNVYQAPVEQYARLLDQKISELGVGKFCMVQSFDPNFLNAFHNIRKDIPLGLLVEDSMIPEDNLNKLTFKPAFYNPEDYMVSEYLLHFLHEEGIKCYAWTINDDRRKKELTSMGVDGIITDYP